MCMFKTHNQTTQPSPRKYCRRGFSKNKQGNYVGFKVINSNCTLGTIYAHNWILGENISSRRSTCLMAEEVVFDGRIEHGFHILASRKEALLFLKHHSSGCMLSRRGYQVIKVKVHPDDVVAMGWTDVTTINKGSTKTLVCTKCEVVKMGIRYKEED